MTKYDCIVVGIGGMGSATLYELRRRGKNVLGIEQFDLAHENGSSHGSTRIIRLAYYEHPSYVPIMKRGYELWSDLEQLSNTKLLHTTGSIDIGPAESIVFKGSKESCELHNLPYDVLNGREISSRFPGYQLDAEMMSVFQPAGGFLEPEKCITSFVDMACDMGAELHTGERVISWEVVNSKTVIVRTNCGEYETENLVFTSGAWNGKLLPDLESKVVAERQVMGWFDVGSTNEFNPENFPVFNLLVPEGRYYGFPQHDIPGFKIGLYHHLYEKVDPDNLDRSVVTSTDEEVLRRCVSKYFPMADNAMIQAKVCMFTNSPDEHFIIDRLPQLSNVYVAAGFSGHGFKYCSVVGEILASMVENQRLDYDIDMFGLDRLIS